MFHFVFHWSFYVIATALLGAEGDQTQHVRDWLPHLPSDSIQKCGCHPAFFSLPKAPHSQPITQAVSEDAATVLPLPVRARYLHDQTEPAPPQDFTKLPASLHPHRRSLVQAAASSPAS